MGFLRDFVRAFTSFPAADKLREKVWVELDQELGWGQTDFHQQANAIARVLDRHRRRPDAFGLRVEVLPFAFLSDIAECADALAEYIVLIELPSALDRATLRRLTVKGLTNLAEDTSPDTAVRRFELFKAIHDHNTDSMLWMKSCNEEMLEGMMSKIYDGAQVAIPQIEVLQKQAKRKKAKDNRSEADKA